MPVPTNNPSGWKFQELQKDRSLNVAIEFKSTKSSNVVLQRDLHLVGHMRVVFLLCFCCVQNGHKPRRKAAGAGFGPAAFEVTGSLSLPPGGLEPSPEYQGMQQNK